MEIPEEEIHIYRCPLDKPRLEMKYLQQLLSRDENEKALRFKFENDKNNYIVCRAILRLILSNYLYIPPAEIKFTYSKYGKPFVKNSINNFNLAHSMGYAVYAIDNNDEVGVDIEFKKELKDAIQIANRFFSENEIKELNALNGNQIRDAFYNCWTRKEAFIKATGEGLSYPLSDFTVTLAPGDEPKLLWIKDKIIEISQWSLFSIEVNNYYTSSLAVRSQTKNIVYKEIEEVNI